MIIGHGEIVAQGTRDELLAGAGTLVRADDAEALGRALSAGGLAAAPARTATWSRPSRARSAPRRWPAASP